MLLLLLNKIHSALFFCKWFIVAPYTRNKDAEHTLKICDETCDSDCNFFVFSKTEKNQQFIYEWHF